MNHTEENIKRIRAYNAEYSACGETAGAVVFIKPAALKHLTMLARAVDAAYPKDKNPDNWRTMKGQHVHINHKTGKIDGGAGGKFNGKPYKPKGGSPKQNATASSGQSVSEEEMKAIETYFANIVQTSKAAEAKVNGTKPAKPNAAEQAKEQVSSKWGEIKKQQESFKTCKDLQDVREAYKKISNMYDELYAMKEKWKLPDTDEDDRLIAWADAVDYYICHPGSADAKKVLIDNYGFTGLNTASTASQSTSQSTASRSGPLTKNDFVNIPLPATGGEAWKSYIGKFKDVWGGATAKEKKALRSYTDDGYFEQNKTLRRIADGEDPSTLDDKTIAECKAITNLIDRSWYGKDLQLVRGISYYGLEKMLKGIANDSDIKTAFALSAKKDLNNAEGERINDLLAGKYLTEDGFSSCGSSVGTGFDSEDVQLHILAPAGTKMIYAEPVSLNGMALKDFDVNTLGSKGLPKNVGGENEMLLQQGTRDIIAMRQ